MEDYFFTTGQIAKQLKCSDQTIRNLCASGQIAATRSAGGYYRISPKELERLKALESMPAVPRATLPAAPANSARQPKHELLAPPSVEAIESAEDAYRTERELATDTHQLARKRIHRGGTEHYDWFEARAEARRNKELEQEQREQEAYESQIRQRQAQAEADERRRFDRKWLSYAVQRKPLDGPDDFAVIVQPEVMGVLSELQADEAALIRGYVCAAVVDLIGGTPAGEARSGDVQRLPASALSALTQFSRNIMDRKCCGGIY